MNELMTISKLQSAKLAVREVKELDEIKRIIDQSEALKGYAKAQQLGREIQDDVAEYALYATRQMGIISAGLEKASKARGNQYTKQTHQNSMPVLAESTPRTLPKTEVLASAGIDKRRANEAEKLAAIPETRFTEIISEKRDAGELTKMAVVKAAQKEQERAGNGLHRHRKEPRLSGFFRC